MLQLNDAKTKRSKITSSGKLNDAKTKRSKITNSGKLNL